MEANTHTHTHIPDSCVKESLIAASGVQQVKPKLIISGFRGVQSGAVGIGSLDQQQH